MFSDIINFAIDLKQSVFRHHLNLLQFTGYAPINYIISNMLEFLLEYRQIYRDLTLPSSLRSTGSGMRRSLCALIAVCVFLALRIPDHAHFNVLVTPGRVLFLFF
jgi:hypothetical protein